MRTGQRLFRLLYVEHLSDLTVNESLSESHSGIQVSLHVLVIVEEVGANFSSRKKPAVKIHQSCTEKRKLQQQESKNHQEKRLIYNF
jgi:hypothetical protein